MKIFKKLSLLVALLVPLLFTSCGGGSGNCGPSALAFGLVACSDGSKETLLEPTTNPLKNFNKKVFAGAYNSQPASIDDTLNSQRWVCGFRYSDDTDADHIESSLKAAGATITVSTPTKWCVDAGGLGWCFIQSDNLFVIDHLIRISNSPSNSSFIEMYMPGVIADHMTVVLQEPNLSSAFINTETRDPSRTAPSATCPIKVKLTPNAIDGQWSGYKANYDAANKVATSSNVSAKCINQSCVFSDALNSTIAFSEQNDTATKTLRWRTLDGAQLFSTATLSDDGQLLSVALCQRPVIPATIFKQCTFYSLGKK